MARYHVYANPFAPERTHTPFVVDVQNDFLRELGTRVVIPLRTPKSMVPSKRGLNPELEVEGRNLILDTASLAPVPNSMLKRGAPLNADARSAVTDALDLLLGGY